MARCSVCDHPALDAINRSLVLGGDRISTLSKRHHLSRQALYRHQAEHLPKEMVEAHAAGKLEVGPPILAELGQMKSTLHQLITAMHDKGDFRGAAGAFREATRLLELIGRISGDLTPTPAVQINIIDAPEFRTVSAKIMGALDAYPEARARVVQALETVRS